MFTHMISALQNGTLPDDRLLRKRFEAALVKKMGVIRTPQALWPADTKINPPAKQLLWAAILLQDHENFRMVEAVISSELEEKQRARGMPAGGSDPAAQVRQLLQDYIDEFIELAPDRSFRKKLQQMARAIQQR